MPACAGIAIKNSGGRGGRQVTLCRAAESDQSLTFRNDVAGHGRSQ